MTRIGTFGENQEELDEILAEYFEDERKTEERFQNRLRLNRKRDKNRNNANEEGRSSNKNRSENGNNEQNRNPGCKEENWNATADSNPFNLHPKSLKKSLGSQSGL